MAPNTDQQLITLTEAAAILRVSKAHLSKIINGKIPGIPRLPAARLGRRVIIHHRSLQEWLYSLDTSRRLG